MRTIEVQRVADLLDTAGKSAHDVLLHAVERGMAEGLTGAEIVALIDELESRLGMPIHPFQF
jgi:hypothetical protein